MKIKSTISFVWEILKLALLALIIVLPIRYFIFQPFVVKGASMEPNFHDGDYLIVDEISYRLRAPERGEVIVFKYPQDLSQRFIKRLIGLPNENIEIKENRIIITTKIGEQFILEEGPYLPLATTGLFSQNIKITLSENEYFVLGDNRSHSFDSRGWGSLPKEDIIGRALFRPWPLVDFGLIFEPNYQTN
ncbi:signal peptidase I [Candidatus Parcubacteria bacterium]|nr:signal peptidase I [Candidatus Parcubacteria bacterium]